MKKVWIVSWFLFTVIILVAEPLVGKWTNTPDYRLVSKGFKTGAKACTDRTFTFSDIPGWMDGADYIMSKMDDKLSDPDLPLLQIMLNKPAQIVVAYDDRCSELPGWLNSWEQTSEKLIVPENGTFQLLKKQCDAGEVILNGNKAPLASSMYYVIIVSDHDYVVQSVKRYTGDSFLNIPHAKKIDPVFYHEPTFNEFFTPEMETAVESVMAKMTIDEKLKMVNGDIEGRGPAQRGSASVDRVGIGTMVFYNGPRGYQRSLQATHFPCGVGMAATFRPELVEQMAGAVARELLSDGIQILEAPSMNIIRDPLNGRNFEYYTEDPVLNGALTKAFVLGGQRAGAITTAKHFIANNKETNRNQVNEVVGDRALREIYLPAFKEACDAGVFSIMTGANRVNGPHASDNPELVSILKKEWKWPGFLYTDWNGVQTTVEAFNAGLDLSMPGKPKGPFSLETLKAAYDAGLIDENTANDKVRRLLRGAYFAGKLAGSPEKTKVTVEYEAHHQLAYETALAGMTLIKNENSALPITDKDMKIAVLGPLANKKFSEQTGGSSGVLKVPYDITAQAGLEKRFGKDRLNVVPFSMDDVYELVGTPSVYHIDEEGKRVPGFQAKYSGKHPETLEPNSFLTTVEKIEFNWEMTSPDRNKLHADNFNAVWTGKLVPPVSGNYTLRMKGSQIVYLYLDGKPVLNKHFIQHDREQMLELEAGREYDIQITFTKLAGDSHIRFSWIRPDRVNMVDEIIKQSVDAAKNSDVALVCIGLDHNVESEGMDRFTMDLPEYHNRLVKTVYEANPRTVVIAYCGSPITMDAWFDEVPAIVLPWFPGIENGNALATVLAGDKDFGGRLPVTFPKRYEDSPAHPSLQQSNKHDTIEHNEGIFVGYRWFDKKLIEPQITFGHGLSYTTFEYQKVKLKKGTDEKYPLVAVVKVQNSGNVTGREVVQVYVSDEESSVEQPVKELAGFQSVELQPNELVELEIPLHKNAFQFFDTVSGKWKLEAGKFNVLVGRSSQDIRLQKAIALKK